jgi:hypothetical protein
VKRIALALLLILPYIGFGQSVTLPAEVKVEPSTFAVVKAGGDCPSLKWLVLDPGLSLIPPDLLKDGSAAVVMAAAPGKYRVLCYGAKGDKASDPVICTVVVGTPAPPVPPTPPIPPEPPAPFPATGLHVLILEESGARAGLTPGQYAAILGADFRALLAAKCVKDADNPMSAFRIWDYDADASAESKPWRDAMKCKPADKGKLPWVVISNGKAGFSGPLPSRIEDCVALVNQYSGGGKK